MYELFLSLSIFLGVTACKVCRYFDSNDRCGLMNSAPVTICQVYLIDFGHSKYTCQHKNTCFIFSDNHKVSTNCIIKVLTKYSSIYKKLLVN